MLEPAIPAPRPEAFGAQPVGRPSHRLTVATVQDIARQLGGARAFFDMGSYGAAADLAEDAERRLRELGEALDRPVIVHTPDVPAAAAASRWARAAGVTVVTIVLVLIAVLAAARPAHAEARPAAAVVPIVVDQLAETFTVTATTDSTIGQRHHATLYVGYPGDAGFSYAGSAGSWSPTVRIRARLDATRVTSWGRLDALLVDDGDGSTRAMVLDVRRRSHAVLTHVEKRPGARVALAVRVTHYAPGRGWISSQLSPVYFQELRADGRWVTIATSTSTRDGLAGAVVKANPGGHLYRAVRPNGQTVWAATTTTRWVTIPGD